MKRINLAKMKAKKLKTN